MKDIDTEYFSDLLRREKSKLEETMFSAKESASTVNLDQSSVGRLSRMDAMQSQAVALDSRRRMKVQLTRIDAALKRIDEEEYGYCAMCDEEINRRRLEVDPANPFCVQCASKM
jgi:DnaK suppressor protein